jgi:hypothetical protein
MVCLGLIRFVWLDPVKPEGRCRWRDFGQFATFNSLEQPLLAFIIPDGRAGIPMEGNPGPILKSREPKRPRFQRLYVKEHRLPPVLIIPYLFGDCKWFVLGMFFAVFSGMADTIEDHLFRCVNPNGIECISPALRGTSYAG